MELALYFWFLLLGLWCVWQILRLVGAFFAAIGRAFAAGAARRAEARAAVQTERKEERKKTDQKRRKEARAGVELLYQLHQHQLGERFPKAAFDDFVQRYLADSLEVSEVEASARNLRALIQNHVRALQPAEQKSPAQLAQARAEVQAFYDEHPAIHAVFPPRRFQAELRVRLPETATAQEAWSEARDMIHEMLALDAEEQEKRRPKTPAAFNPPLNNN